jgi:glucosamine-6-phosphate deaminase
MGGTLIRLNEDGHEVHVAYMTTGDIAVFDHDAQRIADLMAEFNRRFKIDDRTSLEVERKVNESLARKQPGDKDDDEVRQIKELIRWSEAKAAAKVCGCQEKNLHFLDMPFYRTGTIDKKPLSPEDIDIVRNKVLEIDPHQVYIAGDLSDPHGTHRVCADAIFKALAQIEQAQGRRPEALLYRGAWEEWAPHQIELAVPLSPRDLHRKKMAIFRHESQKDSAPFPGADKREFWQRAEDRNRHTAEIYNRLGLPEYFAMEAFVRWKGEQL